MLHRVNYVFFLSLALPLALSLAMSGWTGVFAAENANGQGTQNRGFYFDARTNRYFTNGKASFTIRPVEDAKYLEKIEVSINDSNFSSYEGKLHFDKEGLHQIRFRASDPLMNWSPLQDFRIYVDLTTPESQVSWQGASYQKSSVLFVSPQSSLLIHSRDNLSGVAKVMFEQAGKVTSYSGALQFKSDGEYTVRYAASDYVGNQEQWKDLKFAVDGKAPVTISSIEGTHFKSSKGVFVNSGARVVLAATDDGAGVGTVEYQVNGGATTAYQVPILLADAKTEIRYRAVDQVGNHEAWKAITVLQDTTPPVLAIEKEGGYVPVGGRIYASPGFSFVVGAKDEESGVAEYSFSRDGKSFEKGTSNKVVFDKPGEYHFLARSGDHVGNSIDANPYIIIIDNDAPTSQVRPNERLVQKDGVYFSSVPNQIDISAEDKGVGVDKIEISYDGKIFSALSGPIDVAQWSTPKRTLFYRAVDRLRNREPAKSIVVQVRTEGPKVDLVVEGENLPDLPLSSLRKKREPAAGGQE